jgi:hypothetical protein
MDHDSVNTDPKHLLGHRELNTYVANYVSPSILIFVVVRFAINFFTSIGLGGLTEDLRTHLKAAPKPTAVVAPVIQRSSRVSAVYQCLRIRDPMPFLISGSIGFFRIPDPQTTFLRAY